MLDPFSIHWLCAKKLSTLLIYKTRKAISQDQRHVFMGSYGINLTPHTYAPEAFRHSLHNDAHELDLSIDDSILNEFMGDPEFSMPVMETMEYDYNSLQMSALRNIYHNDYVIDIDIPTCPRLSRYYLFNFVICLLMAIAFGSTLFISIDNTNMETSYEVHLIQKLVQLVIFGFITYGVATPDTYRSINYSIDMLMINWILYSYPIKTTFIYLAIEFIAALIGGYLTIGLYYYKFAAMNPIYVQKVILFIDETHRLTVESFLILLVSHVLLIIGSTFIMSHINSINCKPTLLMTLSFIYSISLIYENTIGPISFSLYKLCIYIAHVSIFGTKEPIQKNNTVILTIVGLTFKLFMYPLIAYYTRYVWSRKLKRYLEYST